MSSPGRTRQRGCDLTRGAGALLALLVFIAGVPLALVGLAPVYLPAERSAAGFRRLLTGPDDGTLLFGVLALIAWLAWAAFTTAVLIEIIASARKITAPRLPALGGMQRAAGRLVATVAVLLALASTSLAHAQPAAAATPPAVTRKASPDPPTTAAVAEPATVLTSVPTTRGAQLPVVTVQRGDTLWAIAERHLGSGARYTEIRDLNRGHTQPDGHTLADADWILPGWTLTLPADATDIAQPQPAPPGEPTITVQPGDTLSSIAAAHLGDAARFTEIADLNRGRTQPDGRTLQDPNLIQPGWVLLLPAPAATANDTGPSTPTPAASGPTGIDPPPPTSVEPGLADPRLEHMPAPQPVPSPPSPPQADDPPKAGAADDSPTRVWFLGLTALGAAGLLGELTRRRLLQQRARRLGETIPMPGRHTAAATAERTLRAAAVPVPIAAITTTLTNLAARRFDTDRDLPRVGAMLLDEHTLTLLLTEDDDAPVAPFTATGPSAWAAAAADVVAEQPLDDADATNPYPLLVTLGHTDDATLIVNLEAAGTLAVVGDAHVADEVLHALVIEAATSDLCSQLAVVVDDELAELRDAFEPHRLRPSTHPDELRATLDDVAHYLAAHGFDDTLQARGDRQAPDLWLPTTFIAGGSPEVCPPWRGAALVARAASQPASWTITVTADGAATLDPLGIGFAPQRLRQDNLQALRDLLNTAVPPVASRPNAPTAPPSATETIDTMRASAPPLEPPVDAPEPRATIALLGDLEFRGFPAGAEALSPRMRELLVYLALHGPTTGADLDDMLWNGARINQGTRNALVYRTRQRVGESVLPRLENGRYALGPAVATDWAQFQDHVTRAVQTNEEHERLAELHEALALVRDRPFRGIAATDYTWADLDIQLMSSAVADAALALGQLLHAAGRDHEAFESAARGMRAEPYSQALQELAIAVVETMSGPEAAANTRTRFIEALAALDPESV